MHKFKNQKKLKKKKKAHQKEKVRVRENRMERNLLSSMDVSENTLFRGYHSVLDDCKNHSSF